LIFPLGGSAFPKYQTVIVEKDTGFQKTYNPNLQLSSYKVINFVRVEEFGMMTLPSDDFRV
jgi:hypothetical protein